LFSIGRNQRVHGAEHAIHPRTGLAAQHALLGFDRVARTAVYAGQELVIHLDQLVEQGLARLDEVTGDERIALWFGEAAQIAGVVAAAELAKLIDDLGIDLVEICAVCKQLLDQVKAHDITLDRGGCRGLGIILEPEQARTCVALGNFDQEIDCRAKAVRHFGGDHIEQRGGGARPTSEVTIRSSVPGAGRTNRQRLSRSSTLASRSAAPRPSRTPSRSQFRRRVSACSSKFSSPR
jgi:hypothetical protein